MSEDFDILSTPEFKLKDKKERSYVVFNLKQVFPQIPERIIVSKVKSKHNTFILSAVLPKSLPSK